MKKKLFLGLTISLLIVCVTRTLGHSQDNNAGDPENFSIDLPDPDHARLVAGLLDGTTRKLSKIIRDYRSASILDKAEFGEEIKKLARERRAYLLETMRRDPDAAYSSLLTDEERQDVFALAPDSVETPVIEEGELEYLIGDFFDDEVSVSDYTLITVENKRIRLHPARGLQKVLVSGMKIRVTGYRLDNELLFDGSSAEGLVDLEVPEEGGTTNSNKKGGTAGSHGGGDGGDATPPHHSIGNQNVLVLLVNFKNTTQPDLTTVEVHDIVFNQVNSYYQETSFGKTSITGDVLGWFNLPIIQTCGLSTVQTAAIEIADSFVDFTQYNRLIIIAPFTGCNWAGWGTIGLRTVTTDEGSVEMSTSWIKASNTGLFLVGHELGHNFGAHHATFLNCGSEPVGSDCTLLEYGDIYDIMGSGKGHWNAPHKNLAWLDPHNVHTVTEDGTYTIEPLEVGSSGVQALRILRKPTGNFNDYLYVEYRQPIGHDANFSIYSNVYEGALLHTLLSPNKTVLIDPTPPSSSLNSALEVGGLFTDPITGSSVAVTGKTPDELTVNVVLGACTDFAKPTVEITSPAAGSSISGTVLVEADAWDKDSPIGRVEFYRDDYPDPSLIGVDYTAPYSVLWDTMAAPNGWNSLYAKAYDDSGEGCSPNEAVSSDVNLYVLNTDDQFPPSVILTAPEDKDKLSLPIIFSADASDNRGIHYVDFWIDPAGIDPCKAGLEHNGPHPPFCRFWRFFPAYSRYIRIRIFRRRAFIIGRDNSEPYMVERYSLPPGSYTAWARAYDLGGNFADSELISIVVKGQRPFRIIILNPSQTDTIEPDSTVSITTEISSDNNELAQVEFWVNDSLVHTAVDAPYTYDWQVPGDRGVTYKIETKAYGLAGRTDSDTVRVNSSE